jgi:hypothetical protein
MELHLYRSERAMPIPTEHFLMEGNMALSIFVCSTATAASARRPTRGHPAACRAIGGAVH